MSNSGPDDKPDPRFFWRMNELHSLEGAGHLVMAPNRRPVRSSYLFNLLDKIILDNPATQYLLRLGFSRGLLKLKQIPMVPGNLYLFWGYRSVHANEACDPDKIRATALFHFGDPHADSGLRRFTGRAKSRSRISSYSAPEKGAVEGWNPRSGLNKPGT